MNKLIDKLRKQREFVFPVDEVKSLTIRRMSELEYTEFLSQKAIKDANKEVVKLSDFIAKFVVDWRGFVEMDFDAGGDNTPVKYDAELLCEWMQDRMKLANDLADAIWKAFFEYLERKAEQEKK
jgi:hypothetical protein